MSLAGTAARGAATTLVGQWLKFAVQTTALVVLARLLTPEDFGLYAMVAAFVGAALLLSDFGLSLAAIQAPTLSPAQRSSLFWLNVAIGTACAAVVWLLAGPIAAFYGEPQVEPVARVLAVVFVLQAAAAQYSADASRHFQFRRLAVVDVTAQALALVAAVVAASRGLGYWSLVVQQVTAAAVSFVALLVASRRAPGWPRRGTGLRSFVSFGTSTTGVQLVNYLSANVDSAVLGRTAGAAELGVYDRAYQIFRMPLQQIASPMTKVALPVLSRITDPTEFGSYVVRAQLVLTYTLAGGFALAVALAEPVLELVLGPGWGEAPALFSILAIGGVFQALGYVYYWIFLAKGATALQLRFSVVTRLLMVGLIIAGAQWQSTGVAVAVSVGLFLNWLILTLWAVPRTGVRVLPLVRTAAVPLAVYTVMVGAARAAAPALDDDLGPVLTALALAGVCAVAFALVAALSPRVRRDLVTLRSTARKGWRAA